MSIQIRKSFEEREKNFMSRAGCLSSETKGRMKDEEQCPIRTAFQVDRERITFSNAFRRLKHKTQVFLSPKGDEYRTRLTHTLEVAQIARSIARAMSLNEDLTEAIALGHDLGHPPFGHGGETALREIYSQSFSHSEQSLRVVDVLENNGCGLNLTYEVRDGILKHSKGPGKVISNDPGQMAFTSEGKVVRIADIMAYLNHDLEDAIKSGVITNANVPYSCYKILGKTHSSRTAIMITDLIEHSNVINEKVHLQLSSSVSFAMKELRQFLYKNVYRSPKVHDEFVKAKKILCELYTFFLNNEDMLYAQLQALDILAPKPDKMISKERTVCDFIASITDRFALNLYAKIFFPTPSV